jgi:hypothetical protein
VRLTTLVSVNTSVFQQVNRKIGNSALMRRKKKTQTHFLYVTTTKIVYTVYPAQGVRPWLLTAEARVKFPVTSCEIHGGRYGTKVCFSPSVSVLPL